jgi:hypothetical protein
MRLGFSPSHGVQLRWNGYFLVGEENPGQKSRKKSLRVQERTKLSPFPPGEFVHAQLLYQHCSSHQQERCRQRRFARINSSGVENALYMSFQAHQVRIYPNLDIQYSRFNSVLRGELPCSPGCIVVNF